MNNSTNIIRFMLKNIGQITNAEVALNQMTVIAGKNSVSKTYITYLIFGFLDYIKSTSINKEWEKIITHELTSKTSKIIINNTSFFIFFSLFIIFFILILLLMIYQYLDLMPGLYIILLFSIVIYIASVIYRKNTISSIEASTIVLNSEIDQNKTQYENSIIQLPNHVVNVSQTLNS